MRKIASLGTSSLPAATFLLWSFTAPFAHAQDSTAEDALARVADVAAPVLAHQDAMARVTGAMAACMLGVGDPEGAITLLQDAGWLGQPGEEGETVFADTGDAATFVTLADDGGDCSVMTTVSGTADVMKNFFDTTLALDWPAFDWADDSGEGCLTADMDATLAVAITGADDSCPSPDSAKISFTIPE